MNDVLTRGVNGRGFDSRQFHHFMRYLSILLFVLISCTTDQEFSMHDDIIQQDLQNKQTELNILRELYVAQQHQDEESFKFFVSEYVRVPRLVLTDEQKTHPDYKEWISDEVIKSGKFMSMEYNYIKAGN